jgi:hypothetical protein
LFNFGIFCVAGQKPNLSYQSFNALYQRTVCHIGVLIPEIVGAQSAHFHGVFPSLCLQSSEPRATEVARVPICLCRRHPHDKPGSIFKLELRPPMAPGPPIEGSGDLGTSSFFGSSSDKPTACAVS